MAWEAKVNTLRAKGDEEREGWAAALLEKARQNVRDREDNIRQLERSVMQMEEILAKEANVKEEVVNEVVEVEVEETVEEKVKAGVEEKVVQEKAVGAGQWRRGFSGARTAGSILHLPWDPAVPAGPHPPHLDHPLLVPRESPIWALSFLMHRVHHKILGQQRWVWADEGGVHQDKALRVGGGGL